MKKGISIFFILLGFIFIYFTRSDENQRIDELKNKNKLHQTSVTKIIDFMSDNTCGNDVTINVDDPPSKNSGQW